MLRTTLCLVVFGSLASFLPEAVAQTLSPADQMARDIFKQLIEINTTDSVGNVSTAAEAMAERLRNAGFAEEDLHVAGPTDRKRNLVVRFRGTGKRKPILFIGHLDVVEALRQDWTTDPFEFIEKDGYFYGRGTEDMKEGDAILVTNFIRLKKEGFRPDRDVILALTADEEGGSANGVDWLLKEHRDWIDAEYCLNLDGGEFEKENGKPILGAIQASEKVYVDFQFESRNPGGHSSVPTPDNAIYHLAGSLARLQSFSFPLHLNEITRNYFERMAALTSGQESADMREVVKEPPDPAAARRLSASAYYNSLLHTTCVATMLSRRPCQECAAADGPRERQLPHFPRGRPAGNPQNARARDERPQSQDQHGRADRSGRKSRSRGSCAAFPAASRSDPSDRKNLAAGMAGSPPGRHHVHRRHRREVHAHRWDSHLRRFLHVL